MLVEKKKKVLQSCIREEADQYVACCMAMK